MQCAQLGSPRIPNYGFATGMLVTSPACYQKCCCTASSSSPKIIRLTHHWTSNPLSAQLLILLTHRCWHAFEQASSSKETAATAAAIPALVSPNADDSANDPNVLAASGAEIIPFLFAAIDQPLALVQELSAPATPQAPSAATDLISPESNMVDSIVATGTDLKMTTTALARECWGGLCPEAWGANATNTTLQWQPISTSQANLTKRDAVIDTGQWCGWMRLTVPGSNQYNKLQLTVMHVWVLCRH